MTQELKTFTVNMKSLDQDIPDPVVAGAGDANGRTFRIIFTQEAAEQFTPDTKVYLKWYHKQKKTKGYNVFTRVSKDEDCFNPPVWEIKWPRTMMYEGDVQCCIEIVDDISITPSVNFIVHVLSDPNDGSQFVVGDDYSIFQDAVIDMNSAADKAKDQMEQQRDEFDAWRVQLDKLKKQSDKAYAAANEALEKVNDALIDSGLYIIEFE